MEFELTTLVVIGTDCIGSCKSNYLTIMTTTTPIVSFNFLIMVLSNTPNNYAKMSQLYDMQMWNQSSFNTSSTLWNLIFLLYLLIFSPYIYQCFKKNRNAGNFQRDKYCSINLPLPIMLSTYWSVNVCMETPCIYPRLSPIYLNIQPLLFSLKVTESIFKYLKVKKNNIQK